QAVRSATLGHIYFECSVTIRCRERFRFRRFATVDERLRQQAYLLLSTYPVRFRLHLAAIQECEWVWHFCVVFQVLERRNRELTVARNVFAGRSGPVGGRAAVDVIIDATIPTAVGRRRGCIGVRCAAWSCGPIVGCCFVVPGVTRWINIVRPCRSWDTRSRSHCTRSEEHTSELQSRENLVCRLLLEEKKRIRYRL